MSVARPPAAWSGYAYAGAGALLFATKGIFIKLAYAEGVDTATLLALRMAIALPFFLIVGIWVYRRRSASGRPGGRLFLAAALTGMLGYWWSSWLDFEGLHYLTAQFERLILFTYPFFTFLFASLLFRRPVHRHAVVGALIAYVGLALVALATPSMQGDGLWLGIGLVLAAAICFGLYQVLAREQIVRIGSDLYTAIAMTGAALAIFVQFAVSGHGIGDFAGLSDRALLIGLALAIFGTVLPAFAMAVGLARIGAQGTAVIGAVSPVFTILLAVSLLGEPFSLLDACGALLVMAGVGYYTLIDIRRT